MTKIIDQDPGLFDNLYLPTLMGNGPDDDSLLFSVSKPLSKAEKKVQKEISKHIAAIEGIDQKTTLVINKRVGLQQKSARAFYKVLTNTEILMAEYQGAQFKAMFEQFLLSSVQTAGKNILGYENLAAGLMSDQMQRDPDPPEKSLRERLFG